MTQERRYSVRIDPPRALARARIGPVLDVGLGLGLGLVVLLVALWLSARTSEDFTDAFTGRMAFRGIGEKTIETVGAALAIVVGVAAHGASRHVRRRLAPFALPATTAPSAAPGSGDRARPGRTPAPPTTAALALALVACVGLGSILLAVGVHSLLGALGADPPPGLVLVGTVLAVGTTGCLMARTPSGLAAGVVAAQGFFAAGVFAFLPPPVRSVGGAGLAVQSWATPLGWIAASAVAVVVVAATVRRGRRLAVGPGEPAPGPVVGPAVVVAAGALGAAVGVPSVSTDGYHFGELVTPPFLLAEFGQLPYIDQTPARGILVNYLPAWVAEALGGPAVGLLQVGFAGIALLVGATTFALMRGLVGPGWAAGLTVVTIPLAVHDMALNDVAMVLLLVGLFRAGRTWPLVRHAALLGVAATVAVLLAPAQGLAFALAGGALFLVRAIQRPGSGRERLLAVTAWAVTAGVVVLVPPLREMIAGALRYVADQGVVNDQVWGIPWADSLDLTSPVAAVRSGVREVAWRAAALPAIGLVIAVLVASANRIRHLPAFPLWVGLGAYAALQLPRALGRIDPGALSRIGLLTIVTVGLVVPLVLLTHARRPPTAALALGMSAVLVPLVVAFPGAPAPGATLSVLAGRAVANPVAADLTADSTTPGAAALARAVVPEPLLEHVTSLAAQYDALLPLGAPRRLLDLTNAQTTFRYLEVDNPLATAAVFNITTADAERAGVLALDADPPDVALLSHPFAQEHDGGGLALRTPVLYEWVLETYTPLVCGRPDEDGYAVWGVRDDAEPPGCTLALGEPTRSEVLAGTVGATSALLALPRAWAAPPSRVVDEALSPQEGVTAVVTRPADADASVPGHRVDVPLPRAARVGSAVLAITLDCGGWTQGSVRWPQTGSSPAGSVTADLGGGKVLLPLGSFPSLARQDSPGVVTIEVPGAVECTVGEGTTWLTRARVTEAVRLGLLEP